MKLLCKKDADQRRQMRTTFMWMTTALGVLLLAVMLIPACSQGDEDALPTSSSALSSDRSLGLASPRPSER